MYDNRSYILDINTGADDMKQSMSAKTAQDRIDREARNFGAMLRDEHWTLEHAHAVLTGDKLDLFKIAGLAKAIACYQCSEG